MRSRYSVALFLAASTALVRADHPAEANKAGHSMVTEAFSEGPRQKADLLPGVAGLCHFPVTTANAEAQKFFDQGVAQLHGFWFLEAERSFRQVLLLDPQCLMAYWGMAMANVENPERAADLIDEGMEKKQDHLQPVEKAWMKSLDTYYRNRKKGSDDKAGLRDLVRAWEQIVVDHPDDIEAKAFLVGRIWRNHAYHDIRISSHLSIDAMARDVLAVAPQHPGIHHYRVHLWNSEKDERALDSAALLGPACSGIAHNWHMPGHTYSSLHRYADAAWQQEASARVDHAHMLRYSVMPDEIHNYAHNNQWLVEDWIYTGRIADAIGLAKNLIELPRIPRSKLGINTAKQDWQRDGSSWTEGRRRLVQALLDGEQWKTAVDLETSPYLESGGDFDEDLRIAHLMALAHFETGDQLGGLRREVALFQQEHDLDRQREAAGADAEKKNREAKKPDAEIAKAVEQARKPFTDKIERIRQRRGEVVVVQKLAEGDSDGAWKMLPEVKDIPDFRLSRYYSRLGQHDKAIEVAARVEKGAQGQVLPLANHIGALVAAGKVDVAKEKFAALQSLAGTADLSLPVFNRLGPLASDDWRRPAAPARDLGIRPNLDTLGPAHWLPPSAPAFSLAKLDGGQVSLGDFKGRPVLLIFFLGKGCTHCMEQLNAFAPKNGDYTAANLPIVAVSTDSVDGLRETLTADKNPFPFPVVSDEKLAAFKAFRAFDDFEQRPLHSTVLIDGQGYIRWQHISFSPFMKVDFLLDEAKRLLRLPIKPTPAVAAGK